MCDEEAKYKRTRTATTMTRRYREKRSASWLALQSESREKKNELKKLDRHTIEIECEKNANSRAKSRLNAFRSINASQYINRCEIDASDAVLSTSLIV